MPLSLSLLALVPKNHLSRAIGAFADTRLSKPLIPWFARRYRIDLAEADRPLAAYPTLNAFFTRSLKPGLRPVAQAGNPLAVVSPVDGRIAQCGPIDGDRLIQAKGRHYTLAQLLGDAGEAAPFAGGFFITIYLAPTDYHRMHHYADGCVTGFRYVPGALWPVNEVSVANVDCLFGINERLTSYVRVGGHPTAIVKVGATVVGKIRCGHTPVESNTGRARAQTYAVPVPCRKGDELALFAMGSTVVLVFPPGAFAPEAAVRPGERVKVGALLGTMG